MAKGIYVGVGGIARKVKKAYIGVPSVVIQGDTIPKSWTEVTAGTSYIANDGTKITANGYNVINKHFCFHACDGSTTTYWYPESGATSAWVQLEFPTAIKIIKMKTYVRYTSEASVKIQGSNNESSWTNLYTYTASQSALTEITLSNTAKYKYYRIYAEGSQSISSGFSVADWQTSEYEVSEAEAKGVARKIKKGYIGVGGIARQFYSSETVLSYYGKATDLSAGRYLLAAANVGNYALFGGGQGSSNVSSVVDTYSATLTKGTATSLSSARQQLTATHVGDYALFGGGKKGASTYYATVNAYNSSLTRSTATNLSESKSMLAATHVGNYALFGGGSGSSIYQTVDTYTSSLVKGTATKLSVAKYQLAATSVGDYAIFAGGDNASDTKYSTVDTYNSSLVKGTATTLSTLRRNLAATTVGDYALFAGGINGDTKYSTVDTYNSSLVKGTATDLSVARSHLSATHVGDYAIFGGGQASDMYATVDAYNTSLTRSTPRALSQSRYDFAATHVGNYALFGGGYLSISSQSAIVDVYQAL